MKLYKVEFGEDNDPEFLVAQDFAAAYKATQDPFVTALTGEVTAIRELDAVTVIE